MHQSRQSLQHSMGSRTSMLSCFRSHRSSGWAADQIQFGGQKKLLEPVCCMSNIFSVFQSSSTDSTCRQKKRLEPLLHVKYFQFSIVAVQIQPAGKKLLEPVCCMSNIFSFPQQLYRFNLGAKKNGWNLFVACQISSVFHSSCTDSTCWQKNGWNLFVACQIFSVFHSSCTDLMCREKTVRTCLLHVKYFQFSTTTVQIQLGGKKKGWNLCCMSNIFSFP